MYYSLVFLHSKKEQDMKKYSRILIIVNLILLLGYFNCTAPPKVAQVPPERIPDLFRDKRVEEWRASPDGSSGGHEGDDGQRGNGDGVDTDELNEELEDLNCVREDYSDGATGIGPEELDLIIDLCNGREIPTDRRLSLLRAIHHIRDTQIERSILESINGSDSRISKFLDEAEQMGGAAPDSD